MKHFRSHCLLCLNTPVQKDPLLIKCMQNVFEWANEMGLKGQRVGDLRFDDEKRSDPLNPSSYLWCQIECTEEEEEEFKEVSKLNILLNIAQQLGCEEKGNE